MPFQFGTRSRAALITVDPRLDRVANKALAVSKQDFGVVEGFRSDADQLKAWLTGHSKLNGIPVGIIRNGIKGTGLGNHQSGHAIDCYPWVNGQPELEDLTYFYPMVLAFCLAAKVEGVLIRWGADWDHCLNDETPTLEAISQIPKLYEARHPGPDFIDSPHFELI